MIHSFPKSKKEQDRDNRVLLGIAFAAIAVVAACSLGQDWSLSDEAGEEIERCEEEHERFSGYKEATYAHPHGETIFKVKEAEKRIFQRIKDDANKGVFIKTQMVASTALGLAGCVLAGPFGWTCIGLGAAGTAITGVQTWFRYTAKGTTTQNKREANELLHNIESLKQLQNGQKL